MTLDAGSEGREVLLELRRLCAAAGDPDAANFYSWSNSGEPGLWRVPDRSESFLVNLGYGRDDMQEALEKDVAVYVRLRARRAAILESGEPDLDPAWSMAIQPVTRLLLSYAGVDPTLPRNDADIPCGWRGGMRVDSVSHSRGCILTCVHIGSSAGGDVSFETYETITEIRLHDARLPETILASLQGRLLREVMPHPVLDTVPVRIMKGEICKSWGGNRADTVLVLDDPWEPLVPTHSSDRPWILPVPIPSYR